MERSHASEVEYVTYLLGRQVVVCNELKENLERAQVIIGNQNNVIKSLECELKSLIESKEQVK
jgi:hypothetical protein